MNNHVNDCIFCKIAAKQIPSSIVYEDEFVIAFHDITPAAPVHILVVPKIHIDNINHIAGDDSGIIEKLMKAAVEVAKIASINDSGYRIINNCGEDGGQTINHLHFHVIGGKGLGAKLV